MAVVVCVWTPVADHSNLLDRGNHPWSPWGIAFLIVADHSNLWDRDNHLGRLPKSPSTKVADHSNLWDRDNHPGPTPFPTKLHVADHSNLWDRDNHLEFYEHWVDFLQSEEAGSLPGAHPGRAVLRRITRILRPHYRVSAESVL